MSHCPLSAAALPYLATDELTALNPYDITHSAKEVRFVLRIGKILIYIYLFIFKSRNRSVYVFEKRKKSSMTLDFSVFFCIFRGRF